MSYEKQDAEPLKAGPVTPDSVETTLTDKKKEKQDSGLPSNKEPWYASPMEIQKTIPTQRVDEIDPPKTEEDIKHEADKKLKEARAVFNTIAGRNVFNTFHTLPQAKEMLRASYEWLDDATTKFMDIKYEASIHSSNTSIGLSKRALDMASKIVM